MRTLAVIVLALHISMIGLPTTHAQQAVNSATCTEALNKEVASIQRGFRAVVFGHRDAASAPIGYVTYEKDGSAWYKVSNNAWRSVDKGYEGTTHFNQTLNSLSEITARFGKPERKGIFETRNASTSELLPYVGVSLRALQCQLYQFCDAVSKSKQFNKDQAPQPITANFLGCQPKETTSIAACHTSGQSLAVDTIVYNNCEEAVQSILEHEAAILKVAVQYDAAYRTLLQLSGSIDLFLQELRWPMTHTLRDATDMITILGRIPCFVSSCEAFPTAQ